MKRFPALSSILDVLSFLKLAHHMTGDANYESHDRQLIAAHDYDRNVLEAPNLNPAWRTYIDTDAVRNTLWGLIPNQMDVHG